EHRFPSGTLTLAGHIAGVSTTGRTKPAVILVHGYPSGPAGTAGAVSAMPELADRIAADMDFLAFSPCLRGIAPSGGDSSIRAWLEALHASVAEVRSQSNGGPIWLAGSGTGGALALRVAADNPSVGGA